MASVLEDEKEEDVRERSSAEVSRPRVVIDPRDEVLTKMMRVVTEARLRDENDQEEGEEDALVFETLDEMREGVRQRLESYMNEEVLGMRAAARLALPATTRAPPDLPLQWESAAADAMLRPWGRRHNPANDASSAHARPAARASTGCGASLQYPVPTELGGDAPGSDRDSCTRWLEDYSRAMKAEGSGGNGDDDDATAELRLDYLPPGLPHLAFIEVDASSAALREEETRIANISIGDVMAQSASAWSRADHEDSDDDDDEDEDEEDGLGGARDSGDETGSGSAADGMPTRDTDNDNGDAEASANGVDAAVDSLVRAAAAASSNADACNAPAAQEGQWAFDVRIRDLESRFNVLRPNLARVWPFEPDAFQKEAILRMEDGESVFVAAHTSAGKTVAAEYAFALSMKHCTKAIYTSPIKTISNQKFRDFTEAGFDVGLLTGDVSIKPESSCLIMTTEILRSMLYKGADLIRDVEWVIFDEVHYVNDADRGVVWEEVIIMLPPHVSIVMLSATVPNVMEFADWVGRTKQKKIFITSTFKRPVPLEHSLFYGGELYTVAKESTFVVEGLKAAKAAQKAKLAPPKPSGQAAGRGGGQAGGRGGRGGQRGGRGGQGAGRGRLAQQQAAGRNIQRQIHGHGSGAQSEAALWGPLIRLLQKRELLPLVVFCFSKRRCDSAADSLTKTDLTSSAEKHEIHVFFEKSLSRLQGSDKLLPQVQRVRYLLRRGIGVHHAGLLPIIKECVEMLFCRGIIRVLFSTETFAMGVNAPARTVAFQSLRKHDGTEFRTLLPGEYTQMAGRAGRRGLDTVGTVTIMCDDRDLPDELVLRKLLTGKATRLESRFRLRYNMILNLLRVEDLTVEDMLKRSFAESYAQRAIPGQKQQLREAQDFVATFPGFSCVYGDCPIEEYYDLVSAEEQISRRVAPFLCQSRAIANVLCVGRVLLIRTAVDRVPAPAVVIDGWSSGSGGGGGGRPVARVVTLVQNPTDTDTDRKNGGNRTGGKYGGVAVENLGEMDGFMFSLEAVDMKNIATFYKTVFDGVPSTHGRISLDHLRPILGQLIAFYREIACAEILDPVRDLKVGDVDAVEDLLRRNSIVSSFVCLRCQTCPHLRDHCRVAETLANAKETVSKLTYAMSDASLQQMPEFRNRAKVLVRMGYVSADQVVQLKGRVACEINSGDELLATEIIFSGVLDALTPEEAVALLSGLVFQEKSDCEPELNDALRSALDTTLAIAYSAAQVQTECGLETGDEYVKEAFNTKLMEVVYEWARGTPFSSICELTDVMEGSIVRCIVRLDETCRELRNAARVCGNLVLFKQMETASALIKRDVIFAASLYVS